jgi:lysophospholipase L1-like esterase
VPQETETPEWDYVALGDSIVALRGSYADHYAAHIEADLSVKVRLENWGESGMPSDQLLELLRNTQPLRDDISEAEIVTLVIGANDLNLPLVGPYKDGECGGHDNRDCLWDALKSFRANYDAILAEILTLCASGTIIRTMTYHYYSLARWGVDEDLRPLFGPLNDHIIAAASENNIPVALVHLAFNGPDGDEDPADKGYLLFDGVHTTKKGAAAIGDLHRQLGYEFTCP